MCAVPVSDEGSEGEAGVGVRGLKGEPGGGWGAGGGGWGVNWAEAGEVPADRFGMAQFGFVVTGGGQGDAGWNGACGQFAQLGGRQVQAEAEVARQRRIAVDQQFGAGAGDRKSTRLNSSH